MNLFVAYLGPRGSAGNIIIPDLAGETIEDLADIRKIRDYIHKAQKITFPKEQIIVINWKWLPLTKKDKNGTN